MEAGDWVLLAAPTIGLLLAVLAALPGQQWPVEIASRDLEGADPKLSASFALALASILSLVVSALTLILENTIRAIHSTEDAVLISLAATSLVAAIVMLARLAGLKAEQFDQSIWFGHSPKSYVVGLAVIVTLIILASRIAGTL